MGYSEQKKIFKLVSKNEQTLRNAKTFVNTPYIIHTSITAFVMTIE